MIALMFALVLQCPDEEQANPISKVLTTSHFRIGCQTDRKLPKPFCHPLEVKVGEKWLRLTRSFPMEKDVAGETKDHPHHRSLWFCHGDVIAEGDKPAVKLPHVEGVDFWTEGLGRGRIVRKRYLDADTLSGKQGNVASGTNEWIGPDGTVLLTEKRWFIIIEEPTDSKCILLCDSTLTAGERAITFGDTKEGSFAVRVNDQMCEKRGGLLRNSNGKKTEKECWGQQADWCDYSGKVDGQHCGLAIFDHPDNPSRACWHARGYGLMAANPFGRAKSGFPAMKGRTDVVKLKPGESLRFRYGVLLYSEELSPEQIQTQYERFVKLAKLPTLR